MVHPSIHPSASAVKAIYSLSPCVGVRPCLCMFICCWLAWCVCRHPSCCMRMCVYQSMTLRSLAVLVVGGLVKADEVSRA